MKAYDFEYDGINLSNIGLVICKFGSDGLQTVSNGSQITFNTVPVLYGSENELLSTEYSDRLETTFQICKNTCNGNNNFEISIGELRYLMSWLNRKEFHKFKLLDDDYIDLYFNASFNISKIEMNGVCCGLELNMITDRPFALHDPVKVNIKNIESNGKKSITDISDEEGFIYPHMEINIEQSGDLIIENLLENRSMIIKNCVSGEKITLDYPIIKTSMENHKIQDDFNWEFFRIANTFKKRKNNLIISIPCTIKIMYSPIIKISI